jgi:hypothetical protein
MMSSTTSGVIGVGVVVVVNVVVVPMTTILY